MAILQSMRALVERNERLHGNEWHLIFGQQRRTFRQFAERARRLADGLYRLGARHQDRISVLAMNCPEYFDVYGAGEVASYIVAPVNFRLAPPEILYILTSAAPTVLVFEQQYTAVIEQLRAQLPGVQAFVCIGDSTPAWAQSFETVLAAGSPEGPPLSPTLSDVVSLMYTSGTTGRPKGVMLTHEGMLALCESWAFELGADVGDRILLSMPMFHIGARSQGAAVTLRGGTIVMHRSFDPVSILQTVEREHITQVHLAPTMVQAVLDVPDNERYDLGSLRTLNYAAAPMPLTLLTRAMRRFGPIMINGYGQTEGAGTVLRKHYHRPQGSEKDLKRLASIGQPTLDAQVRIVDESDNPLPAGAVGEICLRSAQNMLGYWNDSAATLRTLRGGWLHTGDMGYMDEDGFVYLVDRKKDMIISGGENIYSREVEEALLAHPALADAAVIGVPDAYWGEAVKAVVVLKAGMQVAAAELIAHCRQLIASYKCPKSVELVDTLPRLPSGKLNKVQLREIYAEK
jgi:acyl-CoA synthetase (AMP-forming)/AMP-acid ligase II